MYLITYLRVFLGGVKDDVIKNHEYAKFAADIAARRRMKG